MTDQPAPPGMPWPNPRHPAGALLHLVFGLLLLLALGVAGYGGYLAATTRGYQLLAAGAVAVVAVGGIWAAVSMIRATALSFAPHIYEKVDSLNERVEELGIMLTMMSEQQLLSDRAKTVVFREKERDTMRRAIQEEMAKQDFEAALALANDIERSFGYKQEADRFRDDISTRRGEIVRKQVDDGISVIDRFCRGEQWPQAFREAERLIELFPSDDRVRRLPSDIEGRRQQFKQQLVERWRQSMARKDKDVDGSIELLKQLDLYLTPTEAESLRDDARGVLKEKLNNLRQQFSSAVQAHNWPEAIRNGELIVRDFPNTRLAAEVREMMDILHQRASGVLVGS